MTPNQEACSGTQSTIGQWATVAFALLWGACGMKTGLIELSPDASGSGVALGGSTGAGGVAVGGSGGQASTGPAVGGSTTVHFGGSGGNGFGDSGSGGRTGAGGTTVVLRDAGVDVRVVADAMPGSPTIDPNSGYATVSAGTVVMSGYVTSSEGGSGSSISLTYNKDSFCASGTVGASTTYNSWANAGCNVNQPQAGGSGSTEPF